jgi:hypothetical protein
MGVRNQYSMHAVLIAAVRGMLHGIYLMTVDCSVIGPQVQRLCQYPAWQPLHPCGMLARCGACICIWEWWGAWHTAFVVIVAIQKLLHASAGSTSGCAQPSCPDGRLHGLRLRQTQCNMRCTASRRMLH